ncbi:MAG: hypothetical protein EA383_13835 [Spirochaetaceae bacterium]|nr:MAG: hypothetical protein EA383_13835 [Spirochaetaceae bacterium]
MVFPGAWYAKAMCGTEQMRVAGIAEGITYWMRVVDNAGRMGLLYLGEEAGNCSDTVTARWMNAIADGNEPCHLATMMLRDIQKESSSGVELLRMMMSATALAEIQRGTEAGWLYSLLTGFIDDNDFRNEVRRLCAKQGVFGG